MALQGPLNFNMDKVRKVMSEDKQGGKKGPKVVIRKRAMAMALDEAGKSKMKKGMNKSKRMGPPQLNRFK